jgi:hypothetical protein
MQFLFSVPLAILGEIAYNRDKKALEAEIWKQGGKTIFPRAALPEIFYRWPSL